MSKNTAIIRIAGITAVVTNPPSHRSGAVPSLGLRLFHPHISSTNMKILIITHSPSITRQLVGHVSTLNHIVVGSCEPIGASILEEIARTHPHFILFAAVSESNRDLSAVLQFLNGLADVRLVKLQLDSNAEYLEPGWEDALREFLSEPIPLFASHSEAEGTKLVFHDAAFNNLLLPDKLKSNVSGRRANRQLAAEERRFRRLLAGAKAHHQHAEDYLRAVRQSLREVEWELSYRQTRGSYKALCWSRDLVGICSAVLVHYIPGIERAYLPRPTGCVHPQIGFVHYSIPLEGEYAIMALTSMKPNGAFIEMLLAATQIYFTGQSEGILLQQSNTWFGLARVMYYIAEAHVVLMTRWLHQDEEALVEEQTTIVHRQTGLLRDFWDMNLLFAEEGLWKDVLRHYWKDPSHHDFMFPVNEFPSFQYIRESR